MSESPRLHHARAAWRAFGVPAESFRSGNVHALSYGIECDLDHQASYLVSLLSAWDRRDPHWDFRMRAESEVADLADFRARLESLDEDMPAHATRLFAYMDLTAALLDAILESIDSQPAPPA